MTTGGRDIDPLVRLAARGIAATAPPPAETFAAKVSRRKMWTDDEIPDYTDYLSKHPPGMNPYRLSPEQNQCIHQALQAGGGFFAVPMGGGKTLAALLLPTILNDQAQDLRSKGYGNTPQAQGCLRPLFLTKPNLRTSFWEDHAKFSPHFRILPASQWCVESYNKVSTDQTVLTDYKPDWIILDEAHLLKGKDTARGIRFMAYYKEHNPRVVAMSGTPIKDSLEDYAHFVDMGLKGNTYMPQESYEREAWKEVLTLEPGNPLPSEASLRAFEGIPGLPKNWRLMDRGSVRDICIDWYTNVRRRHTGSVKSEGDVSPPFELHIKRVDVEMPDVVREALALLSESNTRADGEVLETPFEVWRVKNQLAVGVYYLWAWPKENGKYIKDLEWIDRRAACHKLIRNILTCRFPLVDSPMHVISAIDTDNPLVLKTFKSAKQILAAWREVSDRAKPPTEAVWLSSFAVDAACKWAIEQLNQGEPAVLWYTTGAVGRALRHRRIPVVQDGGDSLLNYRGQPLVGCSIERGKDGLNLQNDFRRHLLIEGIQDSGKLDQLLCRSWRRYRDDRSDMRPVEVSYFCTGPEQAATWAIAYDHAQRKKDMGEKPSAMLRGTWFPHPPGRSR